MGFDRLRERGGRGMIRATEHGKVTQLLMGKEFDGAVLYSMACYYVDGLLVDSGPFSVYEEAEAFFADYAVRALVNTHHHEDHVGNNNIFAARGVPVYAHELAVPLITDPSRWSSRLLAYQHLVWEEPPASPCTPLGAELECGGHRYKVLHTPGHSPDHICLLEENEGWLFGGDLFLGEKVKMLRSDEDFHQILQTLRTMKQYDFETIFCSSGKVFDQGSKRLRDKIDWWEALYEQAAELKRQGMDEEAIRDRLLGPENAIAQATEGDMCRLNLIESLLSV